VALDSDYWKLSTATRRVIPQDQMLDDDTEVEEASPRVEAPATRRKQALMSLETAGVAAGAGVSAAPSAASSPFADAARSAGAADSFFERFAAYMHHAAEVAESDAPFRQLYQRHVLLSLLEEEVTGINADITAPKSKEMVLSCLRSIAEPETQAQLKAAVEGEEVGTRRRAAAELLSELVKGDVVKEHDDA